MQAPHIDPTPANVICLRPCFPYTAARLGCGRAHWRLIAVLGLLLAACAAAAWLYKGYQDLGRTPMQIFDYIDRRLLGHPKLEMVAHPVMDMARTALHAPSAEERLRRPMAIAPPPPRRKRGETLPVATDPPGARIWRVGPDGPLLRIADAARLARDGDVVEIEAGDYRQDVAVWPQKRLTIRGVNGAARLYADGRVAEGKAIWVLRNGDFDIANIDFIGATAHDQNGAGIRFEGGKLRIRGCLFWGNQVGLLTGGHKTMADATLTVEQSEFAYSRVLGRWAHNLYVGSIDTLTVRDSYFHHAGVGHLIKSRARRNAILYNRLTDEPGGRASYELEFPNGGESIVVGNLIQQQVGTENGTIVSMGAEGYKWPTNALYLASNTIVNDHPHGGAFLVVARGADRVLSANNLLVGRATLRVDAALERWGDQQVDWSALIRPSRFDYRLRQPGPDLAYRPLADPGLASRLQPQREYQHSGNSQPLAGAPRWVGAMQRTDD